MDLFNTINRPLNKKKCISSGFSNQFLSPSECINDRQSFETNQNFLPLNHFSKPQKVSTTNSEPIKLDIDFLVQQAEGFYESNQSKMFSQFEFSPPQISTELNKQNDNCKFGDNFNTKENFIQNKKKKHTQNENENKRESENEKGNETKTKKNKQKNESLSSELLILENEKSLDNRIGIEFETSLNSNSNYLSCKQRESLPFSPPVRTKNPIMYDENFDPVIELGIMQNINQNMSNIKYF
ncbi:hypothetical protein M0812_20137 [Anaeramoeba flamelloides]|uniref:Uncharacterized protein n=1 Tax=Anaeramoeba flamelloides TaxID=1746091 RepID=A0AAV7YW90_9EUKA|nr:hypothetical protein M0812_20137 [Anaeramoeba flamelloides]